MTLRFGKYKGEDLSSPHVPTEYLQWLAEQGWLYDSVRRAVTMELEQRIWARRIADAFEAQAAVGATLRFPREVDRAAALAIVQEGYRQLSLKHHPDRGGDTATMQKVNAAAHWLRHVVGHALPSGG